MEFETPRLILRPWQPTQDARHAMDIFGDARVMKWVEPGSEDKSIRQVQGRLQRYLDQSTLAPRKRGSWAVVQKDIYRVIGHVTLLPLPDLKEVRGQHVAEDIPDGLPTDYTEIGWHFRPASWGFGYATEAVHRIAKHGFEKMDLSLLLGVTQPDNQRSIALMERIGMRYDGITTRLYGGQELLLYRMSPEHLSDKPSDQPSGQLPDQMAEEKADQLPDQ
ncbi:MAG: GNAT family N-acetyltransferase [Cyanobacteria bacterium J06607_13]